MLVAGLGWGLFETSWGIRGFENVLMDVAAEPEEVGASSDVQHITFDGMDAQPDGPTQHVVSQPERRAMELLPGQIVFEDQQAHFEPFFQ